MPSVLLYTRRNQPDFHSTHTGGCSASETPALKSTSMAWSATPGWSSRLPALRKAGCVLRGALGLLHGGGGPTKGPECGSRLRVRGGSGMAGAPGGHSRRCCSQMRDSTETQAAGRAPQPGQRSSELHGEGASVTRGHLEAGWAASGTPVPQGQGRLPSSALYPVGPCGRVERRPRTVAPWPQARPQ